MFSKIQLRHERDVYSLITKAIAKLHHSDMLKLPILVRLELNAIPQQRETPRRHDNKIIARATDQDYARRHQETGKPGNQKI